MHNAQDYVGQVSELTDSKTRSTARSGCATLVPRELAPQPRVAVPRAKKSGSRVLRGTRPVNGLRLPQRLPLRNLLPHLAGEGFGGKPLAMPGVRAIEGISKNYRTSCAVDQLQSRCLICMLHGLASRVFAAPIKVQHISRMSVTNHWRKPHMFLLERHREKSFQALHRLDLHRRTQHHRRLHRRISQRWSRSISVTRYSCI